MPAKMRQNPDGSWQVYSEGGIHAYGTTYPKAKRQVRLLNGVKHGFKPTGKSKHGRITPKRPKLRR